MLNEKGLVLEDTIKGESKQDWVDRRKEYKHAVAKMERTGATKYWLKHLKFAPGYAPCGCKDCNYAKQRKEEKKARIKHMRRELKKEE